MSTIFHELAHFNDIAAANDEGGYTVASCLKKAGEGAGYVNATNWDLMAIDEGWKKMTWADVLGTGETAPSVNDYNSDILWDMISV